MTKQTFRVTHFRRSMATGGWSHNEPFFFEKIEDAVAKACEKFAAGVYKVKIDEAVYNERGELKSWKRRGERMAKQQYVEKG